MWGCLFPFWGGHLQENLKDLCWEYRSTPPGAPVLISRQTLSLYKTHLSPNFYLLRIMITMAKLCLYQEPTGVCLIEIKINKSCTLLFLSLSASPNHFLHVPFRAYLLFCLLTVCWKEKTNTIDILLNNGFVYCSVKDLKAFHKLICHKCWEYTRCLQVLCHLTSLLKIQHFIDYKPPALIKLFIS